MALQLSNEVRSALREPLNILISATLVAVSAALLNPIPLIVGAVAETAYLLFVPSAGWYRQLCAARGQAAETPVAGETIDTRKLLRWFGLFAIAIAAFGFGTDAMNAGLQFISDNYVPDTKLHVERWEGWEVGALIWTTGFAIWFYWTMPLTRNDYLDKKLLLAASMGVLVLTFLAVATIWIYHHFHVVFVMLIACLYCWIDRQVAKNVVHPDLKRDFNDAFWLADIPIAISLGVMVLYQIFLLVHLRGEHYRKFGDVVFENGDPWALFFSGAISFQLLVSSVMLGLIQSGVVRKCMHQTDTLN